MESGGPDRNVACGRPGEPVDTAGVRSAVHLASFVACVDAAELATRLAHGNWCLGTAFYLGDLCFIQQVGGGDEWLVIKENVAFECVSCAAMIEHGTFDDFLARITVASLYACAKLIY